MGGSGVYYPIFLLHEYSSLGQIRLPPEFQFQASAWKEEKERRKIMPSLVATTSAHARTMCVHMHSVRTKIAKS